jgi:outer membrane lipoprotein carrier protein
MLNLAFSILVAAASPQATLARVQEHYAKGDLCAVFEQTYFEKLRGTKKAETGRLWAKRDGRVRWTYEQPTHKDFVYDGQRAWFYEPENAQVTELEHFEKSPLWSAVRFLWGQGKITETFDVSSCTGDCPEAPAGDKLFVLKPKKPVASVDHVVLEVNPTSLEVDKSIVYDALGNRTEYAFKDVDVGCTVPSERFAFSVPKGVSVVHETSDSSQ